MDELWALGMSPGLAETATKTALDRCSCRLCQTAADSGTAARHGRARALLTYVEPERRAFFASQIDDLLLLGRRDDGLLEEVMGLDPGSLAEHRRVEVERGQRHEERLTHLAADDSSRAVLLERWHRRFAWRQELSAQARGEVELRLRVGDKTLAVACPDNLESFLLIFEIFLAEPYGRLAPASLIYDLGANIGLAALFLHAANPTARLVCVEPLAANVDFLRRNLAQNQIAAEIVPAAVAEAPGEVELWVCPQALSLSSAYEVTALDDKPLAHMGQERQTVPGLPLGQLIQPGPCGIKIDIEGAEHALLHSPEVLNDAQWIAGELHFGPAIASRRESWALRRLLSSRFMLELLGPGSFGNTVTYSFRGRRIRRVGRHRAPPGPGGSLSP